MRAYRIRVYGNPRKTVDAHQLAQALLMLARELPAPSEAREPAPDRNDKPSDVAGPDDA